MPTKPNEIKTIKQIIGEELSDVSEERLTRLFIRIHEESGRVSDNASYKASTEMLRAIYEKPKTVKTLLWSARILLFVKMIFHFFLIIANIGALVFLPIATLYQRSWTLFFVAVPVCVYIVNLFFTNLPCSLTKAENALRRFLGMPEIPTFCLYYILWPARNLYKKIYKSSNNKTV